MTEEKWMPGSKAELMSAIEREWTLLMDTTAKLSPTEFVTPDVNGWSAKDNFAHLTEWMKVLKGFYMDLRRAHEVMGVPPEVTQTWDFESRNEFLFERNHHRSLEDVMDEFHRAYGELISRLEAMSFEDLLKPQHPFDPVKRTLLSYVLRGTCEHFAEHRQRMEENILGVHHNQSAHS